MVKGAATVKKFKKYQDGVPEKIKKLISKNGGINFDLGCGAHKQEPWVGMDIRPLPCVDIVHDMESVPYPLPDDCCISILASHVLEHINPSKFGFVNVMNELWRIMKPGGRIMIVVPYAGSHGYWQDPTHCNPINETTLAYFAPEHQSGLYDIYKPSPWRIIANAWNANGNLEAILQKVKIVSVIENTKKP